MITPLMAIVRKISPRIVKQLASAPKPEAPASVASAGSKAITAAVGDATPLPALVANKSAAPASSVPAPQQTLVHLLNRCFKVVYTLAKVRGYKTVGKDVMTSSVAMYLRSLRAKLVRW